MAWSKSPVKLRLPRVPDWGRRAIRSAIALSILGVISHGGFIPQGVPKVVKDEFMRLAGWAEATTILVNDPLIGMIAQTFAEQTLGTISGGMLGYFMLCLGAPFMTASVFEGYQVALIAMIGALSCYVAHLFDINQPSRIFAISFFLVVNGVGDPGNPLHASLIKVGTILLGVLLMQVLSVLILPRSATVQVLRCLRTSMRDLASLNMRVWALPAAEAPMEPACTPVASKSGAPPNLGHSMRIKSRRHEWLQQQADPEGYMPLPAREVAHEGVWAGRDLKENERECEKSLAAVFTSITQVDENIQLSVKNEIYVFHGWGHYFFMPGFPGFPKLGEWLGVWRLPVSQIENVTTVIRRLAQHMWTLHLDLREGFDEEIMEAMLGQPMPRDIFHKLELECREVLDDLIFAFPGKRAIAVDHLLRFRTILQTMEALGHHVHAKHLIAGIVKPEGLMHRMNSAKIPVVGKSPLVSAQLSQVLEEHTASPNTLAGPLLPVAHTPNLGHQQSLTEGGAGQLRKLNSISLIAHMPVLDDSEDAEGGGVANHGPQYVVASLAADPMDHEAQEVIEVLMDERVDESLIPKRWHTTVPPSNVAEPQAQDPSDVLDMRQLTPFFFACLGSMDSRKWSPPQSQQMSPTSSCIPSEPASLLRLHPLPPGSLPKTGAAQTGGRSPPTAEQQSQPPGNVSPALCSPQAALPGLPGKPSGVTSASASANGEITHQSPLGLSPGGTRGDLYCRAGGLSSLLRAGSQSTQCQQSVRPIPPDHIDPEELHVAQVRWAVLEFVIGQIGDELEELLLALAGVMARLPHPLK